MTVVSIPPEAVSGLPIFALTLDDCVYFTRRYLADALIHHNIAQVNERRPPVPPTSRTL